MDNPLTPNKIQRLLHLAEDKSFTVSSTRQMPLHIQNDDIPTSSDVQQAGYNKSVSYDFSSGILDMEKLEGLGESGIGSISVDKSSIFIKQEKHKPAIKQFPQHQQLQKKCISLLKPTHNAFNPGEMTGRSTGTEDVMSNPLANQYEFEHHGRHSINIDSLTYELNKQTSDVNDIMRHSIASNYSFHSKRDLTADEVSLVKREGPLPFLQTNPAIIQDSYSMNNTNLSVGAYFKNRCPEFNQVLSKTESPDKSMQPSITEVSTTAYMDHTLDSVPVRQTRADQEKKAVKTETFVKPNHFPVPKLSEKVHNTTVNNILGASNIPVVQNFNNTHFAHKHIASSSKPTDVLLKNLQSSFRVVIDDDNESDCQSFSISKIADYLGQNQVSNVNVSDMIKFSNQNPLLKEQPLSELQLKNHREIKETQDLPVTYLKDSKKTESASTAGTLDTVISLDKLKINQGTKDVIITKHSIVLDDSDDDNVNIKKRASKSKSPSTKSRSTLSTVQENLANSRTSGSPIHNSKGDANSSQVPSPNVEYRELDRSVDWKHVLQQKRKKQESLAREQWIDVHTTPISGFVGVSSAVTILVTTLTDSWLTASFKFNNLPADLSIEIPRQPILLSPGKQEKLTLQITSNIEVKNSLPFTIFLKDASIDVDVEQYGDIDVDFKMPSIQAVSSDGFNNVIFEPIQEKMLSIKSFVLLSDCPVDLQLLLSVSDCNNSFLIKSVQEIKKSEVNKILLNADNSEDSNSGKWKSKGLNKQLCRLSSENALRVYVAYTAPSLVALQMSGESVSLNGSINVSMLGVNAVLNRIDLTGVVGTAKLNVPVNKIKVSRESTLVTVSNTGSVTGTWCVKFRAQENDNNFRVTPSMFDIRPNTTRDITVSFVGPEDSLSEIVIVFEDMASGNKTTLQVAYGAEKPRVFPIKTNHSKLSFVNPGRKELSLKNSCDKKLYVKCQIIGEGFSIDLPGAESRGIYITFEPFECRPLPIIFAPSTMIPLAATLHLVMDKNCDYSRKIFLYGCQSGDLVRWIGLVTYGDTALVRAVSRAPIELKLYNKSPMPAFLYAKVHFNLQYMCVGRSARLEGATRAVAAKSRVSLVLRADWARLERRARSTPASALASVTVLTGPLLLRARILRIIRNESTGTLDTNLLPDHVKVLAEPLEGDDPNIENRLADFNESKECLTELISGLQELTAQIDLPQDFPEENTIIITDDTVIEHHTLCD